MAVAPVRPLSGKPSWEAPLLWLLALLHGANGAWMLVAPEPWFARVPGVPATGPFNSHFVRDVGCAYLAAALAFALAARQPEDAYRLLLVASAFLSLHALVHAWDMTTGRLPPGHALLDSPGIFVPAIVAIALTLWLRRRALSRAT